MGIFRTLATMKSSIKASLQEVRDGREEEFEKLKAEINRLREEKRKAEAVKKYKKELRVLKHPKLYAIGKKLEDRKKRKKKSLTDNTKVRDISVGRREKPYWL